MYINIDVDFDEIYSSLGIRDKEELVKMLKEDGYFDESPEAVNFTQSEFLEAVDKIRASYFRMSPEDTQLIVDLAKRF